MKKTFLRIVAMLMVVLFSSVAFVSCGDDDEPEGDTLKEKLQGTWTMSKVKVKVLGKTIEMSRDEALAEGEGYRYYDDVLTFSGDKVNGDYYKIDGNEILFSWYESEGYWAKVSFSGSQLVLYYDIPVEGIRVEEWIYYSPGTRGFFIPSTGNGARLVPTSFSFISK
ncbi:MAG: hypothetical protein ACI31A_07380 [Candidatus Limisoma sp.]